MSNLAQIDLDPTQTDAPSCRPPNLIVVGCQKSGTTWLHYAMRKSGQIFTSQRKEVNFFNKPEAERDWDEYVARFPETPGARYYMESTPDYFRLPFDGHDTAASIRQALGQPKMIVIFRNPVERYESAYVHHTDKGRIPYAPIINEIRDDHLSLVEYGKYASILKHWKAQHPQIGTFLYDDLDADNYKFLNSLMSYLELENDVPRKALEFRLNDKTVKAKERHPDWKAIPKLHPDTAADLRALYRDEVLELQEMLGRDLSHWLSDKPATRSFSLAGLAQRAKGLFGR
jgi:hypothetical protein